MNNPYSQNPHQYEDTQRTCERDRNQPWSPSGAWNSRAWNAARESGDSRQTWREDNPNRTRSGRDYNEYGYGVDEFQPPRHATGGYGLQQENHRGKGPKGYVRTDERIHEEICEYLSDDPRIDASEISVEVRGGVVTLEGSVRDRGQKHRTEDIAVGVSGVKDVHNGLRVASASSASNSSSNFAESDILNQRKTTPRETAAEKSTRQ